MSDTCFLAPIHRKGFNFGVQYVQSYNKYYDDDHLFLVFSTQDEIDDFKLLVGNAARYNPILCTEPLTYSKPISQKKLFGVRHVLQNTVFDKVAVTDVDCLFIKHVDYDSLIEQRLRRGKLFVSRSNNPGIVDKVGRAAANKFFMPGDVKRLEKITNGFTDYFWFNDIPVYERKHFDAFASYINYPSTIPKLEYTTFDFILYAYYLLLQSHITLEHISADGKSPPVQDKGSFIEAQHSFEPTFFKRAVESYRPMWLVNPIESANDDVMIKLHVDRS